MGDGRNERARCEAELRRPASSSFQRIKRDLSQTQTLLPMSHSLTLERSDTTWNFVITSQPSDSSAPGSDISTLTEPSVAVTHIHESAPSDSDGDEQMYHRILVMPGERRRIVIIDPNPRYLEDESSLADLSRAGMALINAPDPENLEGSSATSGQQWPAWIGPIIQKISTLVGVGNGTV